MLFRHRVDSFIDRISLSSKVVSSVTVWKTLSTTCIGDIDRFTTRVFLTTGTFFELVECFHVADNALLNGTWKSVLLHNATNLRCQILHKVLAKRHHFFFFFFSMLHARPRGRSRKDQQWDMRTGTWMDKEGFNGIAPPEWKKPVPKKHSFQVRVAQPTYKRPVPNLHSDQEKAREAEELAANERENQRIMKEAEEAHRLELARQEEEKKQREREEYLRRQRDLKGRMKENYPVMPQDGPFLYYMEDGLCKMVYPEQGSSVAENDTRSTISSTTTTTRTPGTDPFVPIRFELDKLTLQVKQIDQRIMGVRKKSHHAGRLLKQRIPIVLANLEEEKRQVTDQIKIWGAKQEAYLKKQWKQWNDANDEKTRSAC